MFSKTIDLVVIKILLYNLGLKVLMTHEVHICLQKRSIRKKEVR